MSVRRIGLTATLVAGCLVPVSMAVASAAPAVPRSLCAPPTDTVGPVADAVTFGRPSIDLNSGSLVQTIAVQASDTAGSGAPSGVAQVRLEVEGNRFYGSPRLSLTSGTSASGTWTGSFSVSKYARAGTYTIEYLEVVDAAGNQQDYSGYGKVPDGPNALSLHPADDPTFAVTGTPARPPRRVRAGTLTGFRLSAGRVNTVSTARRIHVAARFTASAPSRVWVDFDSSRKSRRTRFLYLRAQLRSYHGRWIGRVAIPQWAGRQRLQVELYASYGSRSRPSWRSYNARQLRRRHLPSAVAVTSGVDRSAPRLTSLSVAPDPIDSTTGAQQVTVTAAATDTGSGVRAIDVYGGIRHGVNGVSAGAYPYASAGIGYLSSQNFHVRLRKTPQGTWVGTTTVQQCVPSGTYRLTADLRDVAGNDRYDSTRQLAKANIVSTVDVTSQHGDIVAPYVYSAATYGADHELFLNFSEGVVNVSTSALTVYALAPRRSRYTSAVSIASIVCSNGTTTVSCTGSGGAVTSAVLTIPGLVPAQKYEVWGNLNQAVPQLSDANRNPLNWNYEATEVIDS